MSDKEDLMSDAFQVFMREAPQHAKAWMTAAQNLGSASALDKKGHASLKEVSSKLGLE